METHLKQKALRQLAQIEGEKVQAALHQEIEKIASILTTETQYDLIEEQMEFLDVIAFRVAERAVEVIRSFLSRLTNLELSYPSSMSMPEDSRRRFYNKESLLKKTLETLEYIRYHQTEAVLDIFLQYFSYNNEEISKQIEHALEKIATFDLDIFYGNEHWQGLGTLPQERIIEKITTLTSTEKLQYFSCILLLCREMLSPTIEGTSWTYNSMTFKIGAVPAIENMKKIRQAALVILTELYAQVSTVAQKKAILGACNTATRMPYRHNYSDDVAKMVAENAVTILQFMQRIVVNEHLQIIQKIEQDTYWIFYHSIDASVKQYALEIKRLLDDHAEYQIYKILIGFEGIFKAWGAQEDQRGDEAHGRHADIEDEEKLRERKLREYAESITDQNYAEWQGRILAYASIKSDDLATFPYFGKFLEHLGKTSPQIALRLMKEDAEKLNGFCIPVLVGIWETPAWEEARTLLSVWIDEGRYLYTSARVFEFNHAPDETLLQKLFSQAQKQNDCNTLIQIIAVVVANYETYRHFVRKFFLPALTLLTDHRDSRWVAACWYRKQCRNMLSHMDETDYEIILNNLLSLNTIDFHAEEILRPIADNAPEMVIRFLGERLAVTKEDESGTRYEALPYELHQLSEPLSKIPEHAVEIVSSWYDGNSSMFRHRETLLLKIIFPNFPPSFEQKLLQLVQSKDERNLLIVMAILKHYEGETSLHNICKEIVKALPNGSDLLTKVEIILSSTGVVAGAFGFAEAYERKKNEITSWLNDSEEKVRQFAEHYIANLERLAVSERCRAEEEIALRKHAYGANE